MKRVTIMVGAVVLASLAGSMRAAAQEQEPPALVIAIERSALPDLPDHTSARLTDPDGNPIGNAEITFWFELELLGPRRAFAGSAMTDATGTARIPVTPRQETYRVRASYAGDQIHPAVEATAVLDFPKERVTPIQIFAPPSQVQPLRIVMPRAMGIVVALLWLFFAAATVYVVRSVRRPVAVSLISAERHMRRDHRSVSEEGPSVSKEKPHA